MQQKMYKMDNTNKEIHGNFENKCSWALNYFHSLKGQDDPLL